jgi:nicotinate-nucleotide adenylyltransferase
MTRARRVGIFGGTFDPIHHGHLALAEAVGQALDLEHVIFYPVGTPPHKPGAPVSAAQARYRMTELGIAGNERFAISDLDLAGEAPSYTVDLLREIHARVPDATLVFIIGADSLRDFPTWHDPDGIARMCRLAVGARPGVEVDPDQIMARVPALHDRLDLVETPRLDISATEIRQRVRAGQSIRYLVPDPVWDFIRSRKLYRQASPPSPNSR